MKKLLSLLLVVFVLLSTFAGVGIVQSKGLIDYQNKWLSSYETLLFNTLDGDIGIGEYALDGNGTGYYIRTKPKTEAQFEHVDLTFDYKGLKSVKIIDGHGYYDEFLTAQGADLLWDSASQYYMVDPSQLPSGSVVRICSTSSKYWDTANIKGYPQPTKTEKVIKLPKTEPPPIPPTHHSIAYDNASNSGVKSFVSGYTWSHTNGAAADLLAFGDGHYAATDRTVTGVTYDASALTYIRSDSPAGTLRTTAYFMYAPATGGAKTVSVTYSGSIGSTGIGGVVSYSGAKQSGQPDANNGATSLTGNPSVVVITNADNSWVFDVTAATSALTCVDTQRWNVGTGVRSGGADTNAPKTPAGNVTMSWTQVTSGNWAISAASFAPTVVPPSVDTNPATDVVGTSATLNGDLTATGDGADFEGFVWDTTSHADPGNTDPAVSAYSDYWKVGGAFGVGTFDHDLSGLTPLVTYYFRAFAHGDGGWVYGDEYDFFTFLNGKVYTGVTALLNQDRVRAAAGVPTGIIVPNVFSAFSLPVWNADANVDEQLFYSIDVPHWWDGTSDIIIQVHTATLGNETGNAYELSLVSNHSTPNVGEAFPSVGDNSEVKVRNITSVLTYASYMDVFVVPYDLHAGDPIEGDDIIGFRLRRTNDSQIQNALDAELAIVRTVVVYFARGDLLGEEAGMETALLSMVDVMVAGLLGLVALLCTIAMFWNKERILGIIGLVFWLLFGGFFIGSLSVTSWDIYFLVGFASIFIGLMACGFGMYALRNKEDPSVDEGPEEKYFDETKAPAGGSETVAPEPKRSAARPLTRREQLHQRAADRRAWFGRKR